MKKTLFPSLALLAGLTSTGFSQSSYIGPVAGGDWTVNTNWDTSVTPDTSTDTLLPFVSFAGITIDVPATGAEAATISAVGINILQNAGVSASVMTINSGAGDEIKITPGMAFGATVGLLVIEPTLNFIGSDTVNFQADPDAILALNKVNGNGNAMVFRGDIAANGMIDNGSEVIRVRGPGSQLTVQSSGSLTGSNLRLNTDTTVKIEAGASISFSNIVGDGSIDGDLDASGIGIRPRVNAGADVAGSSISVTGDLTSDSGTNWLLDVDSATSTTDMVNIDGAASLAGTLTVTDPTPTSIASPITLVTFASRGGTEFDSVSVPAGFSVVYTDTAVLLVPEVSTTLPLLAILTPFFFGRRRRKA